MEIEAVRGDITRESVDVVVNAANAFLTPGGGVCGHGMGGAARRCVLPGTGPKRPSPDSQCACACSIYARLCPTKFHHMCMGCAKGSPPSSRQRAPAAMCS